MPLPFPSPYYSFLHPFILQFVNDVLTFWFRVFFAVTNPSSRNSILYSEAKEGKRWFCPVGTLECHPRYRYCWLGLSIYPRPVDIQEALLAHGARARVAQGIAMLMLVGLAGPWHVSSCSSCACSFDHRNWRGVGSVPPVSPKAPRYQCCKCCGVDFLLLCPNSPLP